MSPYWYGRLLVDAGAGVHLRAWCSRRVKLRVPHEFGWPPRPLRLVVVQGLGPDRQDLVVAGCEPLPISSSPSTGRL
jgi:hypothetical protein